MRLKFDHFSVAQSFALVCVLLSGCLDLVANTTTTTPSKTEVDRCRSEMFIQPELKIEPKGFKIVSGIDAAIWFRFLAHTTDIADVFTSDVVDTSTFAPGVKVSDANTEWWDAESKPLIGDSVKLPKAKYMTVGYLDNGDGTLTVYVM